MVRRRTVSIFMLGSLAGVVVTLVALRAMDPVGRHARFVPSAAEIALERTMPDVEVNGLPFDEALGALGKMWGVEVVGDWTTLTSMKVDPHRRVYLRAKNICLADAIAATLDPNDDTSKTVNCTIIGPRIVVTDITRAAGAVRLYDIADLCRRPEVLPDPSPTFDLFPTNRGGQSEEPPQFLIAGMIEEVVAPDSWRDNGGTSGFIQVLGNRLFIAQTWQNQVQIRRLLAQLRDLSAPVATSQPSQESLAVRVWDERVKKWFSPNPGDTLQLLRSRIGKVSLVNVPLEEAVNRLSEQSKAPIYFDAHAFPYIHDVDAHTPVTIQLDNPTLGEALRLLTRADGEGRIGFFIDPGGVVVLTTRGAELSTPVITETYDLRDWLASIGYSRYSDYAIRAAGGTPAATAPTAGLSREDAIEELMAVIQKMVDPDSWRDNGGNVGSIRSLGGTLIVTQSYDNHERIEKLFDAVRADPKWLRKDRPTMGESE